MSTALYRRYRPETFAEVIGQDHVTGPLMQALRTGRVTHAYLFSGPRGCGKTTSARILARTLNCARNTPENPTDTPCGECPSCVELARGGPGSLDVVEIDAASHGGVDDARDLRERATFAPARDRYKIFIIDEAHMVSSAGFNALLKIVEEPPPHIKFVFATTEPDKVIGTIRSRTHHYPFRLVPPDVLGPYLEGLCTAEGIEIGSGVVPLVTRAGGGSVRDSLSVLDQLIAGAEGGAVDYERAVALLGFTSATLLDDVVDALAARDGASIFRVVDHVIASGHEPRRFVEDLLERLRDLIVIAVSGEAAEAVLRDLPADQLARMQAQAATLGLAELSRAADLVNAALTEMTGATSPRLHLELLCARLLLPGADDGAAGFAARLDRLERGGLAAAPGPGSPPAGTAGSPPAGAAPGRVPTGPSAGGDAALTGAAAARAAIRAGRAPTAEPSAEPAAPVGPPSADAAATPRPGGGPSGAARASAVEGPSADVARALDGPPVDAPRPDGASGGTAAEVTPEAASSAGASPVEDDPVSADGDGAMSAPGSSGRPPAAEAPEAAAPTAAAPADVAAEVPADVATPSPAGTMTTEDVRHRWDEILGTLRNSRVTWSLVNGNASVAELTGDVLVLSFTSEGLARRFSEPRHTSAVQDAVYETIGLQVRVEARSGPGGPGGSEPAPGPGPVPPSLAHVGPADPAGAARAEPADGVRDVQDVPAHVDTLPPGAHEGTGARSVSQVEAPGGRRTTDAGPGAVTAPGQTTHRPDAGGQAHDAPSGPEPTDASASASRASEPRAEPRAALADAADEAWLAGLPLPEPPTDLDDGPEPEPVPGLDPAASGSSRPAAARGSSPAPGSSSADGPERRPDAPTPTEDAAPPADSDGRRGAARPTAGVTTPARGTTSGAPPAPASPAGQGPDRRPAGTPATRPAWERPRPGTDRGAPAPSGPTADPDPYDDSSADDPDLASSGLVGVALVVQTLRGTVIEERIDTGE